jgi:hypothetical protein
MPNPGTLINENRSMLRPARMLFRATIDLAAAVLASDECQRTLVIPSK